MEKKSKDELFEEVVENISEEELKDIAAAGDTNTETVIPSLASAAVSISASALATALASCTPSCKKK